jgi:hypothetical protein
MAVARRYRLSESPAAEKLAQSIGYWQVLLASVPDVFAIFSDGSFDAALNIVRGLSQHTY